MSELRYYKKIYIWFQYVKWMMFQTPISFFQLVCQAQENAFQVEANESQSPNLTRSEPLWICSQLWTETVESYVGSKQHFPCSVCDKTFAHRWSLKGHMRGHTGEKPFSCLVCSERFRHINNLNRHIRIHIKGKSFPCVLCKKTFTRNLKKHMKIHFSVESQNVNQVSFSKDL